MGAFDHLLHAGAVPFTAALAVVVALGVVQLLGIGALDGGLDAEGDVASGWFDWLGVGRLPFLVLLTLLLTVFGTGGLVLQQVARVAFGGPLPAWLAGVATAAASLPVTGLLARRIAPLLPRDQTSAVSVDDLVGRVGTVVTGVALAGSPARVRVADRHGHPHFVMAEPANDGQRFGEGEAILLVARRDTLFQAVAWDNPLLPSVLER